MNVLMICTVPLYGNGIATCVINYASALAQQGIETHILAPEGVPADVCDKLQMRNIGLHQLPDRKAGVVRYMRSLLKTLRAGHYDVVHVHGNSCTVAIELLVAMLAGCPGRVAHSHNTSCDHKKAHKLLRPVFELCVNGRLACGQEAGKWLFHNKSFRVLRNGIDLERYACDPLQRKQMRQELGIGENTFVLGHVGAFVPAKNHGFLLAVAKEMERRGMEDWKLLLVGDGPIREQIRSQADSHVLFTGSVADASAYLQVMDMFALPSFHEGLPFVLVEAQAAGLWSLVSDRVSREADMTGHLRFLPIDEPADWVDEIQAASAWNREDRSLAACEALKAAGYDMQDNGQMLSAYYGEILKWKGKAL